MTPKPSLHDRLPLVRRPGIANRFLYWLRTHHLLCRTCWSRRLK